MRRDPERMRALLYPDSMAIVGASADVRKMGGRCVKYALSQGYPGRLYAVHPTATEIQGVPAVASVAALPEAVDLAVLVISANQVAPSLRACAERGVRAALVIASGFAEVGPEGAVMQDELVAIAAETGLVICGPNSNGLIGTHGPVVASSNPTLEDPLLAGRVALISQSGGLGLGSILYLAQREGNGCTFNISTGNEAVVDTASLVEFMVDDPRTAVVAALVEGIKDGPAFVAAATSALRRRKPIVMLKLGRTDAGAAMSESHTALLSGSARVHDGVMRQLGVVQVRDFDELYQVAGLLERSPLPAGNRIGVISPSGGAAILAADLCTDNGLPLGDLAPATVEALHGLLPGFASFRNPLDLTAAGIADPRICPAATELMLADPNIDAILLILTVNVNYDPLMSWIAEQWPAWKKLVIPIVAGDGLTGRGSVILSEGRVPFFRTLRSGVNALAKMIEYGEVAERAEAPADPPTRFPGKRPAVRGQLSEWQSKQLLSRYGITAAPGRLVADADAAVAAAAAVGFPVVMKATGSRVSHKTELDLVRLGVGDEAAARAAATHLLDRMAELGDLGWEGLIVERQVDGGVELFAGLSRDETFGLTLSVGLGGVFVEVLDDVAVRGLPLSRAEARAMLRQLRGHRVLESFRGREPRDSEALVDLLVRLAAMAEDLDDQLVEVDLNPIAVLDEGRGVRVLDALVVGRDTPA